MKEILKLIESVDPSDTAKLDEIDARVWYYVEGHEWYPDCEVLRTEPPSGVVLLQKNRESITRFPSRIRKYTRSRDALKAIRPKGWDYNCGRRMGAFDVGENYLAWFRGEDRSAHSKPLPTEELAELHAIIQAIAHERGEK